MSLVTNCVPFIITLFSREIHMSQQSEIALCPRILKAHFRTYRGKNATIVGKLTNIIEKDRHLILEVDPQSKAEIKVKVNADRDLAEFKGLTYIEVMGIVEPGNDDVIQMTEYTDFKDNFDLKVYNEVVKISNQHFSPLFRP